MCTVVQGIWEMNELIMLLRLVPLVWSQVITFLHVGRIILLIPPLVLLLATILVMSGTNCVTLYQRWSLLPNTGTGVGALLFIGFSLVRTQHCIACVCFSVFSLGNPKLNFVVLYVCHG